MSNKRTHENVDDETDKKQEVRRSGRLQALKTEAPPEPKPKKAALKKAADGKAAKPKKGEKAKQEDKPEDGPAENGETKTEEETEAPPATAEAKE